MASPPHLHHHVPPTATTMKPLDLEITVVSAKHLKNVNWRHGDLKPYAVAYLDPERRSATKPDDAGSTRPVWNERLNLPLPFFSPSNELSLFLTIDVFHSKPSETPKPLVGTVRLPLKDLIDLETSLPTGSANPIKTLELRRPSGRPQGKIRIKLAIRERPAPPPEPNYQFAPPSGYYYSSAPPHTARDYRTYSPPPPPLPHLPYNHYGSYSDPYSGYYSSAAPAPYYSAPPAPAPAPAPTRSAYYERASGYTGPSAPVEYASVPLSSSSYDQRAKGGKFGMGTGLAVGAVAGALGGLALEEGIKYEEEKIAERVESDVAARDDYSDYRADY